MIDKIIPKIIIYMSIYSSFELQASTIIIPPSSSRIAPRSLSLRSSSSPTSVKVDVVDTVKFSRNYLQPILPSQITSSSSSSSCGNLYRRSGQVLLQLSLGIIQSLYKKCILGN
uniref:Uncharacterized protein n=1 Tax=Solanum lycopersicum TaxID=4081 RepID=A0A3Q7ECC5_SOLLC